MEGNAGAYRRHLMADPPQPHTKFGAVYVELKRQGRRIVESVSTVVRERGGGKSGKHAECGAGAPPDRHTDRRVRVVGLCVPA